MNREQEQRQSEQQRADASRRTRTSALRVALLSVLLASAAVVVAYVWWPVNDGDAQAVIDVPGGDIERGRDALQAYGCISCHRVPGVPKPGDDAWVGPPLDSWSQRVYIAGSLTNDPENLIEWIKFPDAIEPGTAMPTLAVSDDDARDIAAYLFSLE